MRQKALGWVEILTLAEDSSLPRPCYNDGHMVDRIVINLPQNERPLDFKDFSYSKKCSNDELFDNVSAIITFTFGRRDPNTFIGQAFNIIDSKEDVFEAKSFAEAANRAWERYKNSEEYVDYVQDELTKKWEELNGEILTGIALKFEKPLQNP